MAVPPAGVALARKGGFDLVPLVVVRPGTVRRRLLWEAGRVGGVGFRALAVAAGKGLRDPTRYNAWGRVAYWVGLSSSIGRESDR
jgi:hypothetical protein